MPFTLTSDAASAEGLACSDTAARTTSAAFQSEVDSLVRSSRATGKGGKSNKSTTQVGGSSSSNSGLADFIQIMKMEHKAFKLFHESNNTLPICFNCQNRLCTDPSACNRRYVCIGCAKEGKPCNECHCKHVKPNCNVCSGQHFRIRLLGRAQSSTAVF